MKTGSNRVFHDFFRGTYIHEKRVLIFFFFFFLLHSSISTNARTHTHTHTYTRENRIKFYTMAHISQKIRGQDLSVIFPFFFFISFFAKKKS